MNDDYDLAPTAVRAAAEEWIVAATIATEVPPRPFQSTHSPQLFTAEMIPLAIRAVAEVIANRRDSPDFPATALAVVLQPRQFSAVQRGDVVPGPDRWLGALTGDWMPDHVRACLHEWRRIARTEGRIVPGALYFYSPVSMAPPLRVPSWVASRTPVALPDLAEDWFRFFK